MLNIENDIALVYLKKKKNEISEIKKNIANYQKLSAFWLTLCARLMVRNNKAIKTVLLMTYYQTETISITDVEKLVSRKSPKELKPSVVCLDLDQMLLYEYINSKKAFLKVKFKAIKEMIGYQANNYLKYGMISIG